MAEKLQNVMAVTEAPCWFALVFVVTVGIAVVSHVVHLSLDWRDIVGALGVGAEGRCKERLANFDEP
jgi:hypothetical protein